MRKAFVVLNPIAGQCDVDVVRQALEQHFAKTDGTHEVYETTGQERVAEIVRAALERGFELFVVKVDGQSSRLRASEVLIVNSGGLGEPYFHWKPHIRLDDGRLDVFVLRAQTAPDYLRVAWELLLGRQKRDPNVRFLSAERSIAINADRPLPVQADGDVIGQTPIQVQVVPNALQVIVPATA